MSPASRSATPAPLDPARLASLHDTLLSWYAAHGRDLPWRRPDRTPWGVFVSEVMLQQTQVSRVEPIWREWLERWPTPAALAAEPVGEVIRAWGRLGYPRRAVRLHAAATVMVERYDGAVPATEAELAGLPGVGGYTAAAVAAFAFGARATVVDTNVRRVQARLVTGVGQAAPTVTTAEVRLAAALLPEADAAAVWNVAVMELGALVCTARTPGCAVCPVASQCAWLLAGRPAYQGPVRRTQRWEGTDRQLRGAILQALRTAGGPVPRGRLAEASWQPLVTPPDGARFDRCLDSLVADGLVEPVEGARLALPGSPAVAGPSRISGRSMPPPDPKPRVTGLLLAAGAGRRMGMPKALVTESDGRSWLVGAVTTLMSVTDQVLVVLGAQAQTAAALLPGDPRVRPVLAADWADGMGASLRAGLTALLDDPGAGDAALVHLVDLPDVTPAVAARVLAAGRGEGTDALVPATYNDASVRATYGDALVRATYGGRPGHPVLVGRRHWAPLAATLRGDRGARDYLDKRRATAVECADLATGLDRDTSPDEPG